MGGREHDDILMRGENKRAGRKMGYVRQLSLGEEIWEESGNSGKCRF